MDGPLLILDVDHLDPQAVRPRALQVHRVGEERDVPVSTVVDQGGLFMKRDVPPGVVPDRSILVEGDDGTLFVEVADVVVPEVRPVATDDDLPMKRVPGNIVPSAICNP